MDTSGKFWNQFYDNRKTKMKPKNPAAVALGSLGGKVKSAKKARTREQAQAAANARWAKHKKKSK